jgi:hypothetical protein
MADFSPKSTFNQASEIGDQFFQQKEKSLLKLDQWPL